MKTARNKREGSRTWIEGIPALEWQKTGQSTFIASLAAAFSVFNADPTTLVTPRELTLSRTPAKSGPAWDYNTLMGDGAIAFRLRWHRRGGQRQTSATPATWWAFTMAYAGGPEDEALLQKATGWRFVGTPYVYPNTAKPQEQLSAIRASIDAGLPVVATLPEEFGVIHGYDAIRSEVLVTGYQRPGKAFWMPAAEIGTKILILTSPYSPQSRLEAALDAMDAAVMNWSRGHVPVHDVGILWENATIRIQYGSAAYEEWADDLLHADAVPERSRRQLWNASAFNMSSLSDARWAAAGYLRSIKPAFPDLSAAHLEAAASLYEALANQASELRPAGREFFGVWSGKSLEDWTISLREQEVQLLMRFMELDAAAIMEMKRAIERVA